MSSILIAISLLATLIVTAFLYVKHVFTYWKRKGIPFKTPSFPFGNFQGSLLQRKPFAEELRELYNSTTEPFIGMYMSLQPGLLVRDPKIIKDMCIKSFQNFDHRVFDTNVESDPMADNILLQKGDKWKQVRTQFSPAFSSGKLKGMFNTIVNCVNALEEHINCFANTDKSLEMFELFGQYTTNVIASVAFGLEVNCIKDPNGEFRRYAKRLFEPTVKNITRANFNIMMPKLSNLLGLRFVDKEVGDFMIETVRQNAEYREKNNVICKDLFQLLMQLRNTGKVNDDDDDWSAKSNSSEKAITLEEIAAHTFLFLVGGHDSSATSMAFALFELAKHAEVQQKVYEEIADVLQNLDGKLTYDSLAEMKFLECCLNESMRMYPPFPVGTRTCSKNYQIPGTNVIIEEGTQIYFSATGLQYDEKYYDEPTKFKPERYSDAQTTKNFESMPGFAFGEGTRNYLNWLINIKILRLNQTQKLLRCSLLMA
ncbi:probable cytochrome P450 6d5 isoform X2 [Contarinia nasturtii]|uniref:probable cytochrome P450 6d5 isoform X2 n=1 Tax=Contarinia nasturtii TaxID=265458 RepID=UPI0012D41AEA|nr:probable cytochrome P450 6d5 isoform X2 [Contarinia nasturtii]